MPETVITRDRTQQLVTERVLILEPMFGLFFVSSFLDGELLWGKSCLSFRVVIPVMPASQAPGDACTRQELSYGERDSADSRGWLLQRSKVGKKKE